MPGLTATSTREFMKLRDARRLIRAALQQQLIEAASAGNRAGVDSLRAKIAEFSVASGRIDEAERAYQSSNTSTSDAERELVRQTRRATGLVRRLGSIAKAIDAASGYLSVVTAIARFFT